MSNNNVNYLSVVLPERDIQSLPYFNISITNIQHRHLIQKIFVLFYDNFWSKKIILLLDLIPTYPCSFQVLFSVTSTKFQRGRSTEAILGIQCKWLQHQITFIFVFKSYKYKFRFSYYSRLWHLYFFCHCVQGSPTLIFVIS